MMLSLLPDHRLRYVNDARCYLFPGPRTLPPDCG
jgi:hypothetical protein